MDQLRPGRRARRAARRRCRRLGARRLSRGLALLRGGGAAGPPPRPQPPHLPARRPAREGRPHEHGPRARGALAVPRHRAARVHDPPPARPQSPGAEAQAGAQGVGEGPAAGRDPSPGQARVRSPARPVVPAGPALLRRLDPGLARRQGARAPVGRGARRADRRARLRSPQPRPRAVDPPHPRGLPATGGVVSVSDGLRSLYICYLSLDDPLVHTQVVAYLEGLAKRGHTIHLLTFDTPLSGERRAALGADLAARGIAWHSLRYHKRPSLPATTFDVAAGALKAVRLVRRHGLGAIHARNHVPAAMALLAGRLTGARLIFDLRGLMAEEYVDAGHGRRGGMAYRITQWVQRRATGAAAAVVVLTHRLRREMADALPQDTEVIPCCVDLDRVATDSPRPGG